MKTKKFNLPLILILLIFFLIRIYKINSLTLFGDEIDVGNQAYSLLKTARDYKGNFLPSYIQSFSESRAPLLMYFTVPFIAIFGLNSWGVRLAPLFFSLLTLVFFYLLVKKISNKNTSAIFSVLILATSPIFFHYSGLAFESTLLLFLIVSATYYYISKKYLVSFILYALSFYTYNTANIFVPLLLFFLFITDIKQVKNLQKYFLSAIPAILLLSPLIYQIAFGSAANRFSLISIFNSEQAQTVEIKRSSVSNPYSISEKIFHNRPEQILKNFSQNYLESLSLNTIFVSSDPNPRHSVPTFGFILLPLCLLLPFIRFNSYDGIFLFWLLAAPIASSLTIGGGHHATRLFLLLPAIAYFLGKGVDFLYARYKTILIIISMFFIYYLASFLHEYSAHYSTDQYQSWGYGYQQLFESIPNTEADIYISNPNYDLLKPYLFYKKIDPKLYQNNFTDQPTAINSLLGYSLDKAHFITDWKGDTLKKIADTANSGDIFVLTQLKDIPGDMILDNLTGFTLQKVILNPFGQPIYQIIQKQ